MKDLNYATTRPATGAVAVDEGLRGYMLRVYNYMASGILLSGIVALTAASSPSFMQLLWATPLKWVVIFAPLAIMFVPFERLSVAAGQAVYWVFTAAMGLSLSIVMLLYTGASVARVFFITAGMFGAMSLYGYTTKADLSRFTTFLMMGVIGIVLASIVNVFLGSSALQFAISVIGVVVFTALVAWNTQMIKETYYLAASEEDASRSAVMGALALYINFVNLFQVLLSLLGVRNSND
jgi:FtsH-binding integral membrane protein